MSTTKHVKLQLRDLVREGLTARGFTLRRGLAAVATADWMSFEGDLTFAVDAELDSDRYGGARLTFDVAIREPKVTEVLRSLEGTGSLFRDPRERGKDEYWVAFNTAGGVRSGQETASALDWTAENAEEVERAAGAFFDVVDGPARTWAEARNTVPDVLAATGRLQLLDPVGTRGCAVLALLAGDVDIARELVGKLWAAAHKRDDADQKRRVVNFDRALAKAFETYGPPTLDGAAE